MSLLKGWENRTFGGAGVGKTVLFKNLSEILQQSMEEFPYLQELEKEQEEMTSTMKWQLRSIRQNNHGIRADE